MEDFISDELLEVTSCCESSISGSKIIACVPAHVRVDIIETPSKQLTVCIMFTKVYPEEPLALELKSKTLSDKWLDGLTKLAEAEVKKHCGKRQVMVVIKFVAQFLADNPLCICNDEILSIKRHLLSEEDSLKLKQRESTIVIKAKQESYFVKCKFVIPQLYPIQSTSIEICDHNFPIDFYRYMIGQAREIARQCIEPPKLVNRKIKSKKPVGKFEPNLSLTPVAKFIIKDIVKRYPQDRCLLCSTICFPSNPSDVVADPTDDNFIERVYCGHIFHHSCLHTYMNTPPFKDGKKCPGCDLVIYHDKWNVSAEVREERWAHKQAKDRELEEVADFLNDS